MGPVILNRWVPQERGPLYFYDPPFGAVAENFDTYTTGSLSLFNANSGFNTIGTNVWGFRYRIGWTQGYANLSDAFFFNGFDSYSAGAVMQITGEGTSGTNIGMLTGYFTGYDSYFVDNVDVYATGNITQLALGSGLGVYARSQTGYINFINPSGLETPDVAWIKFNEGAGTTFASTVGTGANGSLSNAAMWKPGFSGVSFGISGDGSSYRAATSGSLIFNGAGVITVSVRLKLTTYADPGKIFFELCNAGGTIDNSVGLAIYNTAGKIGFNASNGGLTYKGGTIPGPSAGEWHTFMLVANRADGTFKAYIDGVSQTIGETFSSYSAPTTWQDKPLFLCARGDNTLHSSAHLDDVRIWVGDQSLAAVSGHLDTGNGNI